MKPVLRSLTVLTFCCLPVYLLAQPEYTLPEKWEGKVDGKAMGNPYQKRGPALWRLDSIWPNKPEMKASSFDPLVWDKTKEEWRDTEHQQGGQPSAKILGRGVACLFPRRMGG